MYQKMKKEIMNLPVHNFTIDTELVRVKDREQLTLYISYEKKNKKHNKIVKINIEDFSVLENEWIDFVAEMFYMTFISKEEN